MEKAMLEIKDLTAAYGAVVAVRQANLSVRQGQIVALLGANGAGKTSLLKSISGVVKPRGGTITFDGNAISGRATAEIAARGIGHVPEGREIFPQLTVLENLRMGAYLRRDTTSIAEDIDAACAQFPILRERSHILAGLLSGGQQQMLALARALLMRPKLLLMDEPSLGLSPLLTQELFAEISRLNKQNGLTILLVEQNAGLALKVADYVYMMETGRIVSSGPPSDFAAQNDIVRYYLGGQHRDRNDSGDLKHDDPNGR
jgi:branched-chain amino acid transport system ATP-binding protein